LQERKNNLSHYHCYSCDKEANYLNEFEECKYLGHEVLEVLDKIDHDKKEKDETKLAVYAEQILKETKFLTLKDTREIIFYKNGIYEYGGEVLISEKCEKIIPVCTKYKVSEITGIIQRRTFCDRKNINSDFDKIVLENKILDLTDFTLSDHDPGFLSTIKIPIVYDKNARCPKFIKFLHDCLNDPKDIITIIEEISNVLTTNKINSEVSGIWIGNGANGKSTLLKVIRGIFGRENCSNVSIHALQYDRFSKSLLNGKLVNAHSDISSKELNNMGIFKQLVSGDPIPVEKKNKDPFDMICFAKMFFSANEMPDIKDNSDGIFRRIIVTNFDNQFIVGINRIDDYDKILLKEKPGIFNLILENYKTLIRNKGFRYRPNIADVRETIKRESNKLTEFIDVCLIKDSNSFMSKDDVYQAYTKYCDSKSYEKLTKRSFGSNFPTYSFKDGGIKTIKEKSTRVWLGVALNKQDEWVKNNLKIT